MTQVKKSQQRFAKDYLINLVWADHLVEAFPDHYAVSQGIHVSSLKRMWEELEHDWAVLRPTKSISRQFLGTGENRFGPVVECREMVAPLSAGWPKGSMDQAFFISLLRLPREYGHTRGYRDDPWWIEELNTALELRDIFQWPACFKEQGGAREPWYLPDPYGKGGRIPGEFAVIQELAIRRKLENAGLLEGGFGDVYEILAERPWAGPDGHCKRTLEYLGPNWSPVLLETLGQYNSLDARRSVELLRDAMASDWLRTHGPIDPRTELYGVVQAYRRVKDTVTALCPPKVLAAMAGPALDEYGLYRPINPLVVEQSPLQHTWEEAGESLQMAEWMVAHHLNLDLPLGCGGTFRAILESDQDHSSEALGSLTDDDIRRLFTNHQATANLDEQYGYRFSNGGTGVWCGRCLLWSRSGFNCSPYSQCYGWEG